MLCVNNKIMEFLYDTVIFWVDVNYNQNLATFGEIVC